MQGEEMAKALWAARGGTNRPEEGPVSQRISLQKGLGTETAGTQGPHHLCLVI